MIEVLTLEELNRQRPGWQKKPQRNDRLALLWMKDGPGLLEIDLKEVATESNTLYFILPGQLHRLELNERSAGYFISFPAQMEKDDPQIAEWLSRFDLYRLVIRSSGIRLEKDMADSIEDTIGELREGTSWACTLLFIHLSRELETALRVPPNLKGTRLVSNFVELLEEHYMSWKKVTTYALELSVSATYLNDMVKKLSGYCVGYHIRQRIVLEARRLAVHSGDNMKQIAYALGYTDTGHFSRMFKATYGKRFTDFKKEELRSP